MAMDHDELAADLAAHLSGGQRIMVWCDLQLGPAGSPRPDVYTLHKSFMNPRPMAYEVKISRADFRGDVTSGKWQSYLKYAQGVYFAFPAGMVEPAEVPAQCGIIARSARGWRSRRSPVLEPLHHIPEEALLKLLIDGVEREGPARRARYWDSYAAQRAVQEKWGERAGRILADLDAAERYLETVRQRSEEVPELARQSARRAQEEIMTDLPALRVELGLSDEAGAKDVLQAWRRALHQPNNQAVEALRRIEEIAGQSLAGRK